jgi:hypothetical protein
MVLLGVAGHIITFGGDIITRGVTAGTATTGGTTATPITAKGWARVLNQTDGSLNRLWRAGPGCSAQGLDPWAPTARTRHQSLSLGHAERGPWAWHERLERLNHFYAPEHWARRPDHIGLFVIGGEAGAVFRHHPWLGSHVLAGAAQYQNWCPA